MKFKLLLCFATFWLQAQDVVVPSDAVETDFFKIYIGAGSSYTQDWKINALLVQNNIPALQSFEFNGLTGFVFYNNFVNIDIGYQMFLSTNSNESFLNRTFSNGFLLRAHYHVFRFETFAIGTGFNLGHDHRSMRIYEKNTSVDLDNFEGNFGNQWQFRLEKLYLGPSVIVQFKDMGRHHQQTKVTFGYEIGLNNKAWEGKHFEFQNRVFEHNFNRWVLNVSFAL